MFVRFLLSILIATLLSSDLLSRVLGQEDSSAKCYWPNGKEATWRGGKTGNQTGIYYPCNPTAAVSTCCGPSWHCLSDGLCRPEGGGFYERHGCTDPTFKSKECPQFCLSEFPNLQGALKDCGDGSYCCGRSFSCCTEGKTFDIGNFTSVTSIPAQVVATAIYVSSSPTTSSQTTTQVEASVALGSSSQITSSHTTVQVEASITFGSSAQTAPSRPAASPTSSALAQPLSTAVSISQAPKDPAISPVSQGVSTASKIAIGISIPAALAIGVLASFVYIRSRYSKKPPAGSGSTEGFHPYLKPTEDRRNASTETVLVALAEEPRNRPRPCCEGPKEISEAPAAVSRAGIMAFYEGSTNEIAEVPAVVSQEGFRTFQGGNGAVKGYLNKQGAIELSAAHVPRKLPTRHP